MTVLEKQYAWFRIYHANNFHVELMNFILFRILVPKW